MNIIKYATLEPVEREKLSMIFSAVQHIDWLSKVEIESIKMSAPDQRYNLAELQYMKITLNKIIENTKSSDTEKWASDLYVVVTVACDKLSP